MGLDQYAHIRTDSTEPLEICYWRKHANLNQWMTLLAVQKGVVKTEQEFNCVALDLLSEDIDALEAAVCQPEGLPHGEGFFWGKSSLEDKLVDLDFIRKARKAIKKGYKVSYSCWW